MKDRQVLVNAETYGIHRGKINENFLEIWTVIIAPETVLLKTNNTPYTPVNPYNPATKSYADSLETNWQAVYNPQTIAGDVFLRSNHTGNISAVNVTQDSSNRFTSDAEKSAWSAKENAIGPKNTAFNKDFGTIAGTVSNGDHLHNQYEPKNTNIQIHVSTVAGNPHGTTPADLSLGSVDNTSDIDKPISTAAQSALDDKLDSLNTPVVDFDPNLAAPAYKKGRLFYDASHDAISYFLNEPDVSINIGKEMVMDVYNGSGTTIPNGTPVHLTGLMEATLNRPLVHPAQANTFDHAKVIGVTTHDIANGETGIVTRFGVVHDFDLSAFNTGDTLYLSDTVEGGFTATAPGIITSIGVVFKNGALAGALFVDVKNNISLPNTFANLDGKAATLTPSATYQNLENYTSSDGVVDTPTAATGTITASKTGKYEMTVTMALSFADSGNQTEELEIQLWDETGAAQVGLSTMSLAKNSVTASRSFSRLFNATQGNIYVLRLKSSSGFTNVITFEDLNFYTISL